MKIISEGNWKKWALEIILKIKKIFWTTLDMVGGRILEVFWQMIVFCQDGFVDYGSFQVTVVSETEWELLGVTL